MCSGVTGLKMDILFTPSGGFSMSGEHYLKKNNNKKEVQEVCENCRKLGQSSYSEDYIQGVLDSMSPEFPLNSPTKEVRQEESLEFDFEVPD